MRNLKKVLSLTLALVMLLGMMVVGAGAAEYTDAGEIEYKEAAEVMSAIGVFNGMDGKFNPQGNLTRAQAAKIITYMVLGQAVADKLPNTGSKFSDCPDGQWYVGSVNYLTDIGIVAGQGNGTFNPDGNVTGVEFAKMLLGILGYDAVTEKFVNDPSWAANIAVRARQAGLDANMTTQTVNSVALNRDQASMMAFNTLTATMVSYVGGVEVTNADGTTVKVGGQLTPVANATGPKGQYDSYNDGIMQFCEQYFPGLKLVDNATDTDDFGRYINVWKLDNKTVCEAATWAADATFITKVKESDVKAAIGKAEGRDSSRDVSATELVVNGFSSTPGATVDAKYIADLTGNGRLVEVYLTDNLEEVYQIVVVDTALGEVTKVDTKAEKITIKLSKSEFANAVSLTTDIGYGDFEKDAVVRVTAYGEDSSNGVIGTGFTVATVDEAETVVGLATKKYDDKKIITLDGTDYNAARGMVGTVAEFTLNGEDEATLYLDGYGNILKAVPGKKVDNGPKDNVILVTDTVARNVDGKIVKYVVGINSKGEEVEKELATVNTAENVGSICVYDPTNKNLDPIDINDALATDVKFKNTTTSSNDMQLYWTVATGANDTGITKTDKKVQTKTGDETVGGVNGLYYASNVKFIYIDSTGKKVSIADGMQTVAPNTGNSVNDKWSQLVWVVTPNSKGDNGEVSAVFVKLGSGVNAPVNSESIIYVAEGKTWTTVVDGKTRYQYENVYIDGEYVEDQDFIADIAGAQGNFYYVRQVDGIYMLDGRVADSSELVAGVTDIKVSGKYISTNNTADLETTDKTTYVDAVNKEVLTKEQFLALAAERDLVVDLYKGDGKIIAIYVTKTAAKPTSVTVDGGVAQAPENDNFVPDEVPTSVTVGSGSVATPDWGDPKVVMGFTGVFAPSEDNDGANATLYITKTTKGDMYSESITLSAANKGVLFYVQLLGKDAATTVSNHAGTSGQLGASGSKNELSIGTYTWSIEIGSRVVSSGSFVITNTAGL